MSSTILATAMDGGNTGNAGAAFSDALGADDCFLETFFLSVAIDVDHKVSKEPFCADYSLQAVRTKFLSAFHSNTAETVYEVKNIDADFTRDHSGARSASERCEGLFRLSYGAEAE
jgi:hypothetical protein